MKRYTAIEKRARRGASPYVMNDQDGYMPPWAIENARAAERRQLAKLAVLFFVAAVVVFIGCMALAIFASHWV